MPRIGFFWKYFAFRKFEDILTCLKDVFYVFPVASPNFRNNLLMYAPDFELTLYVEFFECWRLFPKYRSVSHCWLVLSFNLSISHTWTVALNITFWHLHAVLLILPNSLFLNIPLRRFIKINKINKDVINGSL